MACLVQKFACLQAYSSHSPALFGHDWSHCFLNWAIVGQDNCGLEIERLGISCAESGLQQCIPVGVQNFVILSESHNQARQKACLET